MATKTDILITPDLFMSLVELLPDPAAQLARLQRRLPDEDVVESIAFVSAPEGGYDHYRIVVAHTKDYSSEGRDFPFERQVYAALKRARGIAGQIVPEFEEAYEAGVEVYPHLRRHVSVGPEGVTDRTWVKRYDHMRKEAV